MGLEGLILMETEEGWLIPSRIVLTIEDGKCEWRLSIKFGGRACISIGF
jgi:hypothetical protein